MIVEAKYLNILKQRRKISSANAGAANIARYGNLTRQNDIQRRLRQKDRELESCARGSTRLGASATSRVRHWHCEE
jgi:hypothetical protein